MQTRVFKAIIVAFLTARSGLSARRAFSPNPAPYPISLTFLPNELI